VSTPRIVQAGDSVLIVELEERIDPAVNATAIAIADAVQTRQLTGVLDVVPTYRSVAVYFDPLRTDYDALHALLERQPEETAPDTAAGRAPLRIPVCYGGDLGPDLEAVAAFAALSADEVVRLHSASTYRVFMLGFVPGFAYMGIVDERIAAPRHATPRLRVPVGSVGIAGVQTGIYPAETPGGWHIVGRTAVKPFDATRAEPFLLTAGDLVQFYAIDRAEFDAAAAGVSAAGPTGSASRG
jgi:inhibitor of KinA